MIHPSSIDQVLNAAAIEDVVGDYLTLKKRGANYIGLCPFHDEKTPSFYVSAAKGIYKCFGCGKGGNVASFLMEQEQISYPEAIRKLAERYQITIEETQTRDPQQDEALKLRESLFLVLSWAGDYYKELLKSDPDGSTIGLAYFKERGFTRQTIDKFGLGWAHASWDHMTQSARSSGYNLDYLEKAGLIKKNETGNYFDLLRERVIFPIHNVSGKIIAFAGRRLKAEDKSPKYINSPETEVYHKSDHLYGLYFAKQAIKKADNVYLVEGYTDVITLHQAGIENAVASSGTSLTEGQCRLLARFSPNVTILFDGDPAGIKASLRGIDLLLTHGLNVRVVPLPLGEDPDTYCQKQGPEAFSEYLRSNTKDFILFKTELLMKDTENDPVGRTAANREVLESLSHIGDPLKRAEFTRELAKLTGAPEQILTTELNKLVRKRSFSDVKELDPVIEKLEDQVAPDEPHHPVDFDSPEQEKKIIELLMRYGDKMYTENTKVSDAIMGELLSEEDLVFHDPLCAQLVDELKNLYPEGVTIDSKYFVHHPDPAVSQLAADLLGRVRSASPNWEKHEITIMHEDDNYREEILNAFLHLRRKKLDMIVIDVMKNLKEAQENQDEALIESSMTYLWQIQAIRMQVNSELGAVVTRY